MDATSGDPAGTRYRCTHCGNLTRFDVTVSRRTRSYHHYTVGGELRVEETEVLAEAVEGVVCRWCGTGEHVVALDTAEVEAAASDAARTDRGA